MIATFSIKNFLSIKSPITLSFEATKDTTLFEEYSYEVRPGVYLLKMGLIYGANASGKSNILEGLNILCRIMSEVPDNRIEPIGITPFLLDEASRRESSSFDLSFYLDGDRYVLNIVLDNQRIYSEKLVFYPSSQPALLYERYYDDSKDLSIISWGSKSELSKREMQAIEGNTINNCSVLAAWSKSNVASSRFNRLYAFFFEEIFSPILPTNSLTAITRQALKEDKDGTLKAFIQKFLVASDFNISDIEIQEVEIPIDPRLDNAINKLPLLDPIREQFKQKGSIIGEELFFSHKTDNGTYQLPEELESRGTIQMLGLSVFLYELLKYNRIISIDEVEASLHYELLSYFIRTFLASSERASQLILSTHDLNLLNEDYLRRDTIWFTNKNSCAETELTRLNEYGLHKNISPYNAYRQNKLSPLPFLGSQYIDLND